MEIDVLSIVSAFIVLGIFSSLYKHNPVFSIVEKLVLGVTVGQAIMASIQSIWASQVSPLVYKGDLEMLLAVGIGSLYVTVLSRRLVSIYRAVMMITAASMIASGIPGLVHGNYGSMVSYATEALKSPSGFVLLIVFVVTVFYFLYGIHFDRTGLRVLREMGRYAVFMGLALMVGVQWFRFMNQGVGWIIKIMDTQGIYVLGIFAVALLADSLVGFGKLMKASA